MTRTASILVALCLAAAPAAADLDIIDSIDFVPADRARGPWGVAVDSPAGRVYVAGLEPPHCLAILDAATLEIRGNIPLVGTNAHGVDVWPEAHRAYVVMTSSGHLCEVDTETGAVVNTALVGGSPHDVAVNGLAGRIYVPRRSEADVVVLDSWNLDIVAEIPVGAYPIDLCVDAAGGRVFVANLSDWTVSVIEGDPGAVVTTIPVGAYPEGIAYCESEDKIYVANRDSDDVSVISGENYEIIATVPAGDGPSKVVVDPLSGMVFVSNRDSDDVTVIDSHSDEVVATVPVGRNPIGGIAVDPQRGRVFCCNYTSEDLTVIDIGSLHPSSTIRLGWFPRDVAYDRLQDRWFVSNSLGNNVAALSFFGGGVVWDTTVGYSPGTLAANSFTGRLYVTLPAGNLVITVDSATGAVLGSTAVPEGLKGIAVDETSNLIYTASYESRSVGVIDGNTGDLIDTILLPWEGIDVAVDETRKLVYVTAWFGMLYAIDAENNELLGGISLSGWCEPGYLAVNERSDRVIVNAFNCDVGWVLSGWPFVVLENFGLPGYPGDVCVNRFLQRHYACHGDMLSAFDEEGLCLGTVKFESASAGCDIDESRGIVGVGCPASDLFYYIRDDETTDAPVLNALRLDLPTPNPTTAGAVIRWSLSADGFRRVEIYDIQGRRVRVLRSGPAQCGEESLQWDGRDEEGRSLAAGVYLLRLLTEEGNRERKICLIR